MRHWVEVMAALMLTGPAAAIAVEPPEPVMEWAAPERPSIVLLTAVDGMLPLESTDARALGPHADVEAHPNRAKRAGPGLGFSPRRRPLPFPNRAAAGLESLSGLRWGPVLTPFGPSLPPRRQS